MNYRDFIEHPSIQAFLLAAVAIYFIFRLFQFANKRFVQRQKYKKTIRKALYFIEFISWLIFVLESASYFANSHWIITVLLSLVLVVVVGWTAWFVVRDYVAGLYLKWNDVFKINELVDVNGVSGKIIHFGNRTAVLETSPLHTIKVPFNQLFSGKVVETGLTGLSANASFTFNLPDKNVPVERLEEIRVYIYQLPWVNFNQKPIVVIEKQEKEATLIRISASLLDDKYIELFENNIRSKFE